MRRFFKLIFWILTPLGLVALILAASRGELVFAQGLTPPAVTAVHLLSPTPPPSNPAAEMARLASPTVPPNPSQADQGSIDYWLNCSPCHGDRGQGLTDEFRQGVYPTEDQNCWLSGCHGRRPYPNGWTIPVPVPALIGPGALTRFGNAAVLEAFISLKMPFQRPGSLPPETYWRLTAFLLRQNGYWPGVGLLDPSTAERVRIPTSQAGAAPTNPALTETPSPLPAANPAPAAEDPGALVVRLISAVLLLAIGLGVFLLIRYRKL